MPRRLYLLYLVVLVALVVFGAVVDLPFWALVAMGVAAVVPIVIADVVVNRRKRSSRDGSTPGE
ncbi:hypothetical protein COUCH_02830 [Couchioplanes caeruleus]|uniref:hypothetical protein n=1 Tax=Couchioplanes caeruleus TaxID=56438 RepID=UPI0020C0E659|nr:hypothetical protein [Couchioplanes caeruleus]UQU65293.1 hypothetical protein COUCH_02830 [Couchioplanes caeruleus]